MIVVDVNVITYLTIRGPFTPLAEQVRVLDPDWCVPVLWRSEYRNILARSIRGGFLTLPEALDTLSLAEAILSETEYAVDSALVLQRAVESGCTAYDSEYAVLAEQLRVTLVTNDKHLAAAYPDTAVLLADYVRQ